MIKIIKGSYGMRCGNVIRPITANSDPIALDKEKEARLVRLGVAVYVNEDKDTEGTDKDVKTDKDTEGTDGDEVVDKLPEYSDNMKLTELKEIATTYGVDASSMKSKKEVIEAIDAAREELPAIDADDLVE